MTFETITYEYMADSLVEFVCNYFIPDVYVEIIDSFLEHYTRGLIGAVEEITKDMMIGEGWELNKKDDENKSEPIFYKLDDLKYDETQPKKPPF